MEAITHGDSRRLRVTATYPEAVPDTPIVAGDPFPLTGHTCRFTARLRITDETAVFVKSTAVGIAILTPNNIAEIAILPTDTLGLPITNSTINLRCDFEVTTSSGEVWTLWEGELPVKPGITR